MPTSLRPKVHFLCTAVEAGGAEAPGSRLTLPNNCLQEKEERDGEQRRDATRYKPGPVPGTPAGEQQASSAASSSHSTDDGRPRRRQGGVGRRGQ